MNKHRFAWGLLVLIFASLACNLGTSAPVSTPTLDATTQAEQILATGFAELTSAAPSSTAAVSATETGSPSGTPIPSLTPAPTFTTVPTNTAAPSATNTPPPPIPDWPLVRLGDTGSVVAALQHLLNFNGSNLTADGDFGQQTRNAVVNFQNNKGLGADGIVGPLTWSALIQGAQIQQGSTGRAVRAAQHLLSAKFGYGIGVDGIFGPQTDNAVRDFQSLHGLGVDGIIGPKTWQALVSFQP